MTLAADQRSGVWIHATAARLKRLYTALVYDVMDEMGMPNQCLDLAIKPLDRRMRVAGPAFTVVGGPDPRTDAEYRPVPKVANFGIFEAMYDGCVPVVNASGERQSGQWGELMSTAAKARGATGVVLDGGIRDGNLLFEIKEWPVFARYLSPVESRLRYRVWDIEVPIAISGTLTSQVRINPGDWIFGDMDGVVVVPTDALEEVLRRAEEAKVIEDKVRAEVSQGAAIQDVYKKYGRL